MSDLDKDMEKEKKEKEEEKKKIIYGKILYTVFKPSNAPSVNNLNISFFPHV